MAVRSRSPIGGTYDTRVNRESAYEILGKRSISVDAPAARSSEAPSSRGDASSRGQTPSEDRPPRPEQVPAKDQSTFGTQVSDILWGTKRRQGMVEAMAKQAARRVGSEIGRRILRGPLGGILGGSRR
jgi:hypothetical protein